MIHFYVIKNCDTCRTALKWLESMAIDFQYFDLRKDCIDISVIQSWIDFIGWEALLNKRGLTWRGLPDNVKSKINATNASKYMYEKLTLIKRPVFEISGKVVVGFNEQQRQKLIALL